MVLGVPKEKEQGTGKAMRPQLSVLRYKENDFVDICTDSLSMRGYVQGINRRSVGVIVKTYPLLFTIGTRNTKSTTIPSMSFRKRISSSSCHPRTLW